MMLIDDSLLANWMLATIVVCSVLTGANLVLFFWQLSKPFPHEHQTNTPDDADATPNA